MENFLEVLEKALSVLSELSRRVKASKPATFPLMTITGQDNR
jgi:hypothetical protein